MQSHVSHYPSKSVHDIVILYFNFFIILDSLAQDYNAMTLQLLFRISDAPPLSTCVDNPRSDHECSEHEYECEVYISSYYATIVCFVIPSINA